MHEKTEQPHCEIRSQQSSEMAIVTSTTNGDLTLNKTKSSFTRYSIRYDHTPFSNNSSAFIAKIRGISSSRAERYTVPLKPTEYTVRSSYMGYTSYDSFHAQGFPIPDCSM